MEVKQGKVLGSGDDGPGRPPQGTLPPGMEVPVLFQLEGVSDVNEAALSPSGALVAPRAEAGAAGFLLRPVECSAS